MAAAMTPREREIINWLREHSDAVYVGAGQVVAGSLVAPGGLADWKSLRDKGFISINSEDGIRRVVVIEET